MAIYSRPCDNFHTSSTEILTYCTFNQAGACHLLKFRGPVHQYLLNLAFFTPLFYLYL